METFEGLLNLAGLFLAGFFLFFLLTHDFIFGVDLFKWPRLFWEKITNLWRKK